MHGGVTPPRCALGALSPANLRATASPFYTYSAADSGFTSPLARSSCFQIWRSRSSALSTVSISRFMFMSEAGCSAGGGQDRQRRRQSHQPNGGGLQRGKPRERAFDRLDLMLQRLIRPLPCRFAPRHPESQAPDKAKEWPLVRSRSAWRIGSSSGTEVTSLPCLVVDRW